eukprot:9498066-Pyramimonas_sp.AAC.1
MKDERSIQKKTSPDTHDLRCPHLRRASQEPTKVATVAQFTAPEGAARSQIDMRCPHIRIHSPCLPGAHESGDGCTVRSSRGSREVSA